MLTVNNEATKSSSDLREPPDAVVETAAALHVVIVGHVDHGKSTVIGRLLADTGSLPQGKLEQVKDRCRRNSKPFEYSFLLDALKDEQAQGITIDSARVFFKTARRHYVVIDAPGHVEFLKNMVTGASRADAALLVIDADEGVRENSRRHGFLLSMLGIEQVAVLVTKMDLVGYRQSRFNEIEREYRSFLHEIGVDPVAFLPVSGSAGENLTGPPVAMEWYRGPNVVEILDGFPEAEADADLPFRLAVQDVYKFTGQGDTRRIVAGTVASGSLAPGDEVVFHPSGTRARVRSLERFPVGGIASPPGPGDAVGFTLHEQIYARRGDVVSKVGEPGPSVAARLEASLFWLGRAPMVPEKRYLLRVGTAKVPARLEKVQCLLDASSLSTSADAAAVPRHAVADCIVVCEQPLAFDALGELQDTNRFVIIEDYEIVGGGVVRGALPEVTPGVAATAGVSGMPADPELRRFTDIRQLIGSPAQPTPLVRLNRVVGPGPLQVFAKLEGMNPFGSIKDRTALYLLKGLQERGELDGRELVEPTSGNTGIALAALAALLGLKLTVTIPDAVPLEKQVLLRMLGATVWPTPDDLCPIDHPKDGAIALAHSIVNSAGGEGYLMPNQYENQDNVRAHYETTGPEIWRQTEGRVSAFFAGYGTCGTLTGVGRYLKEQDPAVRIVAVEPERGHRLPGLKNLQESKQPTILDPSLIDEVMRVDDGAAYAMTKRLFREEGLIVGPSTGAIIRAAADYAGRGAEGVAVAISPDGGFKYASYYADILGDDGLPGV